MNEPEIREIASSGSITRVPAARTSPAHKLTSPADDPILGTYKRAPVEFTHGAGVYLYDATGRRYLDFVSGIAVNALGYADPGLQAAMHRAADGLVHVSNLYGSAPGRDLAAGLIERSFASRVFFCNSGAEANEGAFKFARRWARRENPEKVEIVAFRNSFHGRTFGALAATDRPAFQEPFTPLMPGVRFCEVGSVESVVEAVQKDRTAAVIIEPIQAEGGMLPVAREFFEALREICDREGALLIFDEVQVGLGRTGTLWAHEAAGVT